ncbi:hypothetical protein P8Q88_04030 [Qipengyuania sp. XHP0207]|uniref:hypothetical protein n=1 Tax=Qipengyuania sp. XHP0207 TaxID=3038078 RepID=UPI00241C5517|nr:hypothetical protein [Qipengyuania sp. XHP0207]MDG5747339.1 hypothetical protein [Qipengyuania sp. XHP0207]
MRRVFLIALPLWLVACGSPESAPDDPVDATAPTTNPLIERFDDVKIVVNANGLGAYQQEPVAFGAPRSQVDTVAERAFGSMGEQTANEECGAGPMEFTQYGPLQVGYLDGKFAGWFLREGYGVVTSDGIRPGVATLDTLKGERQVQELDTTLEGEFQYTTADYGTITGFADDAGNITALQAGVSCFFR